MNGDDWPEQAASLGISTGYSDFNGIYRETSPRCWKPWQYA